MASVVNPSDLPPFDLPLHHPLPELAAAVRSSINPVLQRFVAAVRQAVPKARPLPFGEVTDNIPRILPAMADALAAAGTEDRDALLQRSPNQGITRFQQHYSVAEVMLEDRMLRVILIQEVEQALARRMTQQEQLALDTATDMMLQQAVVAFTDHQQAQLRSAAEAELKYLSFLAHDLNNNFSNVTVWLQVLRQQLAKSSEWREQLDTLDAAQQAILATIGGMGRLLQAERLRKGDQAPRAQHVNLRTLVSNQTRNIAVSAERKGLKLEVQVPPDAEVEVDPELLALVLQNLLGNAIKFSHAGTVRVEARHAPAPAGAIDGADNDTTAAARWMISISDQGPGIEPAEIERIFQAFSRGHINEQTGMGLGLAIASEAARLLGAELTVQSKLGAGSTFTFSLPV
ncbi:MAG TPA: HAMP domain-containing sensor histidine kinase [Tepidisphaeraceae bacterium]